MCSVRRFWELKPAALMGNRQRVATPDRRPTSLTVRDTCSSLRWSTTTKIFRWTRRSTIAPGSPPDGALEQSVFTRTTRNIHGSSDLSLLFIQNTERIDFKEGTSIWSWPACVCTLLVRVSSALTLPRGNRLGRGRYVA